MRNLVQVPVFRECLARVLVRETESASTMGGSKILAESESWGVRRGVSTTQLSDRIEKARAGRQSRVRTRDCSSGPGSQAPGAGAGKIPSDSHVPTILPG